MKKLSFALISFAALLTFSGCATLTNPGLVTSPEQTVANAVTDVLTVGLVPILTKNSGYVPAAAAVAASLSTFSGSTITPDDVNAFLSKTSLSADDSRAVAGLINAAWATYVKRYSGAVGANVRPDVKLFLQAVADGINGAIAAVPKPSVFQPLPSDGSYAALWN